MTAATSVKLLAESYYSKLWIGAGTAPDAFDLSTYTGSDAYFGDPVAKTTFTKSVDVSSYTSTSDYVGKFVKDPSTGELVEVTNTNKDSLDISVTGTKTPAWDVYADKPLPITPQLGWCYVDASTGDFYIFDGSTWQSTESKWTGAFL